MQSKSPAEHSYRLSSDLLLLTAARLSCNLDDIALICPIRQFCLTSDWVTMSGLLLPARCTSRLRPLCKTYMPFDVSRNDLRGPRKRGEIVLNEVINDRYDSCHVQHNVHIGLEPKLLTVVMDCICVLWFACTVCGGKLYGVIVTHGPLQTVQAHAVLPDCKLFGFVQGSVGPVKGDFGCLQRQQIRACIVDMDELHLQCISGCFAGALFSGAKYLEVHPAQHENDIQLVWIAIHSTAHT